MYVHPTYAVPPDRNRWACLMRGFGHVPVKDATGQRGGPKDSLRWIEGYERIAEIAVDMPGTRLVYVADREADLMPLMGQAQELGTRPTS